MDSASSIYMHIYSYTHIFTYIWICMSVIIEVVNLREVWVTQEESEGGEEGRNYINKALIC